MSTMNVYCAGGASTNIGSSFVKYDQKTIGFAEMQTFFIDTSRSNLSSAIPNENVYLVDNVDGSGKKRDSNYQVLSESSHEILHQFRPADVNVVVHSGGGGTGSTIGPILVSELINRGQTTIVVVIGSTASKIETENTLKTLKSYEMISRKRERPVVVFYRENTAATPRSQVDDEVAGAIMTISSIFSGDNKELDSSDLKNFINYDRVTSYSPKLAMFELSSKEIVLEKGQSLISLVTLVDDKTSSESNIPVEYQAVGYLPDATRDIVTIDLPIHAAVIGGHFNPIVDRLEHRLSEFDDLKKAVIDKPIVRDDVISTDIGVVL